MLQYDIEAIACVHSRVVLAAPRQGIWRRSSARNQSRDRAYRGSGIDASCLARQCGHWRRIRMTVGIGLFLTLMFAVSMGFMFRNRENKERNYLLKQTSEPCSSKIFPQFFYLSYKLTIAIAPLLNLINITLPAQAVNNAFLDSEPSNTHRHSPSPEVDAAWDRLQTLNPIPITHADVPRIG